MKRAAGTFVFILFLLAGTAGIVIARPVSDFQRADALFSSQKYKEALILYQRTLISPPAGIPAGDIHTKIGDSHFRLGSFASALAAFREAGKDRAVSDPARVQYWIGFCCFLTGRDAEAVQELLKVPQLYPNAGMWISTAYYWAGKASERMGKKDQAAEYFRKAAGSGRTAQGKFAMKKAEAAKGK